MFPARRPTTTGHHFGAEPCHLVQNPDGSYTYNANCGVPDGLCGADNDSPAFGAADGELTGQPLQDGTYTVLVEDSPSPQRVNRSAMRPSTLWSAAPARSAGDPVSARW